MSVILKMLHYETICWHAKIEILYQRNSDNGKNDKIGVQSKIKKSCRHIKCTTILAFLVANDVLYENTVYAEVE